MYFLLPKAHTKRTSNEQGIYAVGSNRISSTGLWIAVPMVVAMQVRLFMKPRWRCGLPPNQEIDWQICAQ